MPDQTCRRGFGLIDVSLGLIAGFTVVIGGIILVNQVNISSGASEVLRATTAISSSIRGQARNLASFQDLTEDPLDTGVAGSVIDLARIGLDAAVYRSPAISASAAPVPNAQTFTLRIEGISTPVCRRAASSLIGIEAGVISVTCLATGEPVIEAVYGR